MDVGFDIQQSFHSSIVAFLSSDVQRSHTYEACTSHKLDAASALSSHLIGPCIEGWNQSGTTTTQIGSMQYYLAPRLAYPCSHQKLHDVNVIVGRREVQRSEARLQPLQMRGAAVYACGI